MKKMVAFLLAVCLMFLSLNLFETATQAAEPVFIQIACGESHVVALKSDGSVWSWGKNQGGILGDGTIENKDYPVKVKNLEKVIFIEAGKSNSVAVKSDGTVWTWGSNAFGQLGTGRTNQKESNVPVQVSGLTGVKKVALGESFMIALKKDDSLYGWGLNNNGTMGNGISGRIQGTEGHSYSAPIQIPNITEIKDIACGANYVVALKNDGTVWTWGSDINNTIEKYDNMEPVLPKLFSKINDVKAISSGAYHVVALKNDGTVWTWGSNNFGQYCASNANTGEAIKVTEINNGVKSITCGQYHTIAVKSDGSVWSWGFDNYIDFEPFKEKAPNKLNITNVKLIDGGMCFNLFVKNDNTLWGYGVNRYGQLTGSESKSEITRLQTASLSPSPAPIKALNPKSSPVMEWDNRGWFSMNFAGGENFQKTFKNTGASGKVEFKIEFNGSVSLVDKAVLPLTINKSFEAKAGKSYCCDVKLYYHDTSRSYSDFSLKFESKNLVQTLIIKLDRINFRFPYFKVDIIELK